MVLLLSACGNEKKPQPTNGMHAIDVTEVLQVSGYTYAKGTQNNMEIWLAGPTVNMEVGKTYYYGNSMEMQNFESKELGKTFSVIYFVSDISESPDGNQKFLMDATDMYKYSVVLPGI